MKITYTMLKKEDAWGLRVSEGEVQEGDEVTVTLKDGRTKKEVVDQVVWTGDDRDGLPVQLCTIVRDGAPAPREARHATPATPPPRFTQHQGRSTEGGDELDDDIPF
jgi:hypothetical protein